MRMFDGWMWTVIIVMVIVAGVFVFANLHPYTVRFEMDDKTLEAVKSIDWNGLRSNGGEKDTIQWKDSGMIAWQSREGNAGNYTWTCCYPGKQRCSVGCVFPVGVYDEN